MTERDDRAGWADALDRRTAAALEWAEWALERWSAFPARETPRPLVLVQSRVRAEHGFATGHAKRAFLDGLVQSMVELPAAVIQALQPPDRRVPAADGEPLRIHSATRDEVEFLTDRGPRGLPAWRLSAEHALGAIWVLDPEVRDWTPAASKTTPPGVQGPGHTGSVPVELAADDRSLLLPWPGAAPNFERYPRAEVLESSAAVSIVAVGENIGPPGARTLVGYVHRVPAVLKHPLAGRVLVDPNGNPLQVIRQTEPAASST